MDMRNDTGATSPAADVEEALSKPNLLTDKPEDVAKRLVEEFDKSEGRVKPLKEQWRINKLRSKGYTGLRLIKIQDEQKAHIPLGSSPNMAAMNQAARLRRRMRSQMFTDPPLPEATPSTDEDQDRDSAEFATRVLQEETSEGRLSFEILAADAFDLGSDYGSGFLHFSVDPNAGGYRPLQIWASPRAQSKDEALFDPTTGEPWKGQAAGEPDFILRYVLEDGTLTDDVDDDKVILNWQPRLKAELLTGKHVRFIPDTARDLWEAEGVSIGAMTPLGTLKALFSRLRKLPAEKLNALVKARPANVKDLLPRGYKESSDVDDNTPVFTVTRYLKQCPDYPRGAYLVAAGEDVLLWRSDWWDGEHKEPLDIPLTQFKQFNEEDNPYGIGLMEFLGPGNELRAFLFGAILEHLDRFTRRKIFLPSTSNLQAEQLQSETQTVLSIVPGGEPVYEQLPDLPSIIPNLFKELKDDLNDESGLQETAQGLAPPNVKSGVYAEKITQQVLIGLADLRQNTERGLVRGWRMMLQLIRAFYTVPQQIRWVGEDGGYKQREFLGTDLGNTRDVRLQRGSFTGLSRTAKASLAMQYAQTQLIDAEELRSIITGNVGGELGLEDDPHRQRVRRQVDRWGQGPPKNWQPPRPTLDPATGQPVAPPPDPALAAIFAPIDADEEPKTALLRAFELGRAMAGTRYSRWDPAWQQGLRAEYLRMRTAAGIQTVADQQRAQQAAAQQQQAAQAAATQQQQQQAARDHELKSASLVLEGLKAGASVRGKVGAPAPAPAPVGATT
jgi:hypothetical protein